MKICTSSMFVLLLFSCSDNILWVQAGRNSPCERNLVILAFLCFHGAETTAPFSHSASYRGLPRNMTCIPGSSQPPKWLLLPGSRCADSSHQPLP
jgi:hypothetical protein